MYIDRDMVYSQWYIYHWPFGHWSQTGHLSSFLHLWNGDDYRKCLLHRLAITPRDPKVLLLHSSWKRQKIKEGALSCQGALHAVTTVESGRGKRNSDEEDTTLEQRPDNMRKQCSPWCRRHSSRRRKQHVNKGPEVIPEQGALPRYVQEMYRD